MSMPPMVQSLSAVQVGSQRWSVGWGSPVVGWEVVSLAPEEALAVLVDAESLVELALPPSLQARWSAKPSVMTRGVAARRMTTWIAGRRADVHRSCGDQLVPQ
jgi:hypothetical protein